MREAFGTFAADLIEDSLEDLIVFIMEPEDEHADIVQDTRKTSVAQKKSPQMADS